MLKWEGGKHMLYLVCPKLSWKGSCLWVRVLVRNSEQLSWDILGQVLHCLQDCYGLFLLIYMSYDTSLLCVFFFKYLIIHFLLFNYYVSNENFLLHACKTLIAYACIAWTGRIDETQSKMFFFNNSLFYTKICCGDGYLPNLLEYLKVLKG